MKLYTEESILSAIGISRLSNNKPFDIVNQLTPIELPSDDNIFWNDNKPNHIDNYIVHKGAEGVSLGWWNGEEWIEMWGTKKLNVYGWIKIPNTPTEWMKNN